MTPEGGAYVAAAVVIVGAAVVTLCVYAVVSTALKAARWIKRRREYSGRP